MSDSISWVDLLRPAAPDGTTTIAAERARSNIDPEPLSRYLLGDEFLERQKRILPLLQQDPLFSKATQANLSRPDRYMLGLARSKRMRQMADKYNWDDEDYEIGKYLLDDVSPYQLHQTMFRQTLLEQTSPEQKKYWMDLHSSWTIIGAYAQTELGHGSNVRGIELTARWDPETKEFVLHSPTLTASKWWNGTLGRTATHSIVAAQLLLPENNTRGEVEYKNYGVHMFVTRVRDAETHKPLPGLVIGDIGPKYGYASMDNAYMLFNNFRIPHNAMLSRYCRVDPDTGKYHKPENPAVAYGSMTHARKRIILAARLVLARAVTIAVRYCCIRRQFRDKDSGSPEETAVLDYPTVQIRLLPLLAATYALHFTGERMGQIYDATRASVDGGDLSRLIDLHSLSSGLKSLCSDLAAGGIEICRRSMGGHGFGGGSGLVQLNADYLSKPTVEGDNWMITQQMARYLMKKAELIAKGGPQYAPANQTEELLYQFYHRQSGVRQNFRIFDDDKQLVAAFAHRAAYLTFEAYKAFKIKGKTWNSLLVQMHELSHAQSECIVVSNFYEGLLSSTLPRETVSVLWDNFRLFSLFTMQKAGRHFSRSGAVSEEDLDDLPDRILKQMQVIRPHAVRLVDAWAIPDYLLDSALGRSDGRVYEDLFNRAHRLNPLNKMTFNPDYRTDEIVMGSDDGGKILWKL
ncbi:acyl-CoA dehydrogenase/oxidase C-terminal [Aspergillus ambiguus]|uniref:acyl-CoA dehydrogenase/oxidase C-terminal n=1 Tax=Aspergillus ambiguus TaxID=176160 RepID=UPI003CCCC17A